MSDYGDREWLWLGRQLDRISPVFAHEVHERFAALESQLAQLTAERDVMEKVEAVMRKNPDETLVGVVSADGRIDVWTEDLEAEQVIRGIDETLSAALAALVAAAGREEGK